MPFFSLTTNQANGILVPASRPGMLPGDQPGDGAAHGVPGQRYRAQAMLAGHAGEVCPLAGDRPRFSGR
jgi:hypothetical protein